MTRYVLRSLLLLVVAFALACTDAPSAPPAVTPADDLILQQAQSDIHWARSCPTVGPLSALAILLLSNNNDDRKWVVARIGELNDEVRLKRRAKIQERAHALVEWLLKRYQAGKFRGTDQQFAALINAIYCFAGIDMSLDSPTNTELVMPSDQPQVVTTGNGQAGVHLDANPVTEPTLLTVTVVPDTFTTNEFLDTKLDQYPGFVRVTKSSENDAPLAKPVVVGVCASGVIPAAVRARLRLGHGKATGFEIAAPGNADFLSCPNSVADAGPATGWQRLAELVLPQKLLAFQAASFGGGVGGTVTEFSPFAPVDPVLEFGGGVGGTVTEFTRTSPVLSVKKAPVVPQAFAVAGPCPTPIEGAMGSPVRDECRPYVRITTRLGTPFIGVPVTWDVTQGGGVIAANTATCGVFGVSAATTTGPNGGAGICWTLGALGANQVRATPSLGGDAVAGVSFSQASTLFDAIANPPAGLAFTVQPPEIVQSWPRWPIEVTVVDKNGERVWGSTDRIFLGINQNTFGDGETELNIKALDGVARYDISVPIPGAGYQITGSTPLSSWTIANGTSSTFTVVPGAPYLIQIVGGSGVTAPTGSVVNARVRVTDRAGNAVPGATVSWVVVPESPGSAAPTTSVTDASGETQTNWTIGSGLNFIRAILTTGSLLYVTLSATGSAP